MTRTKLFIVIVSVLMVALAAFVIFRSDKDAAVPEAVKPSTLKRAQRQHRGTGRADAPAVKESRLQKRNRKTATGKKTVNKKPMGAAETAMGESKNLAEDSAAGDPAAEKAVEAWEGLIDKLSELTDTPTAEQMVSVKEAFDSLNKNDQEDAIKTALNLLPDEQFIALYGILLDKVVNEDILDAIFSDALNRSDEIKIPLMKELVKDKTHPMYFESVRILDVTGELDKTTDDETGERVEVSGEL
jgi:hypothetical protein